MISEIHTSIKGFLCAKEASSGPIRKTRQETEQIAIQFLQLMSNNSLTVTVATTLPLKFKGATVPVLLVGAITQTILYGCDVPQHYGTNFWFSVKTIDHSEDGLKPRVFHLQSQSPTAHLYWPFVDCTN